MAEKAGFTQPLLNVIAGQNFGLTVGFLPQTDLTRIVDPSYQRLDSDSVRLQLIDSARDASTRFLFSFNATPISKLKRAIHLPTVSNEQVENTAHFYSNKVMTDILNIGPVRIQSEVLLLPLNIATTAMALHELGIDQFPLFTQLNEVQKRLFLTEVARAQRSYYKDKPEVQQSIDDFIKKLNEKVGGTPSELKG